MEYLITTTDRTAAQSSGDMGSKDRLNYTVTGDIINNPAFRPESITKRYGVPILFGRSEKPRMDLFRTSFDK